MGIVEDFVGRYRREYDFYDQAARLAAQQLEARLQAAGVRAMVTSRAKAVARLEPKVRDRAPRKRYVTVDDIYADVPDLAGARVALYFPAQRPQVDLLINDLFIVTHTKEFPEKGQKPAYDKRFSGYSAVHYRVRLREAALVDAQKRYAEARVEVQVASVLMHAWAEVEHDLVYKPYQGRLSEDEYAVLDELNGMVMAGEIALERLQRAGEVRVAARGRGFENHYELAAHLLSTLRELADPSTLKTGLGRVDLLYEFLREVKLATPEAIARYLTKIHSNLERRPIADQIADEVLSEDPERYGLYEQLRAAHPATDVSPDAVAPIAQEAHEAMGEFLNAWIDLERVIRDTADFPVPYKNGIVPAARLFSYLPEIDPQTRSQYEGLRRMRNQLVHGIEAPDPAYLRDAAQQLRILRDQIAGGGKPASSGMLRD
jgi:ppGpp synthetase/RelA/SpoT-type nucleotidyltranferase